MSFMSEAEIQNYEKRREQAFDMQGKAISVLNQLQKNTFPTIHTSLQAEWNNLRQSIHALSQKKIKQDIPEISIYNEGAVSNIDSAYNEINSILGEIYFYETKQHYLINQSISIFKSEEQERIRQEEIRHLENKELKSRIEVSKKSIIVELDKTSININEIKDKILGVAKSKLDEIFSSIDERTETVDTVLSHMQAVKEEFRNSILLEEQRCSSLESIYATLEGLKMSVKPSYNSKDDNLVIRASKQTGEDIVFKLSESGVHYEFEGFEGDTCFDSSDEILGIMQDTYGIVLDDRVLIKGNPDRIKKTAKANPVAPKYQQKRN